MQLEYSVQYSFKATHTYIRTYVCTRIMLYVLYVYIMLCMYVHNAMHTIDKIIRPFNAHNHLYIIHDATDNNYIDEIKYQLKFN